MFKIVIINFELIGDIFKSYRVALISEIIPNELLFFNLQKWCVDNGRKHDN